MRGREKRQGEEEWGRREGSKGTLGEKRDGKGIGEGEWVVEWRGGVEEMDGVW